jgi:hypothetical protein
MTMDPIAVGAAIVFVLSTWALRRWGATPQAPKFGAEMPSLGSHRVVTLRGTVEAVDKAHQTVTLKREQGGAITLEVLDPPKLDAVTVGDPVVAVCCESLALEVRKAGSNSPRHDN